MAHKAELKELVQKNKELFGITNNNNFIIEATIAYAIYNALGGKKLIPLPPFTDILYNIVYHTAIVKLKIGNKITIDMVQRAEKYLVLNIPNIKALEMINGDNNKLKMYTSKGVYMIDIIDDTTWIIARMASICIMESCKNITQDIIIHNMIYNYFSNIGRN